MFSRKAASGPSGSRRWPRTLQLALVALLVIVLVPAVSLAKSLTAPSTDPLAARAAEWARGHGLGFLITAAEELSYRMSPPKSGGQPDPSLLRPAASQPRTPGDARSVLHASLRTIASPSLPGEGVFRTVVSGRRGPAVQLAYLRPDRVHTSYLAAVMVMDPGLIRFVQHPGYAEPGRLQLWSQPDLVAQPDRGHLAATFNGGFKLGDAQGGYYADGHTVGTLRPGAASLVITRDGRLNVGSWADEVGMTSQVVSVRQNLRMLIDHGRQAADVAANAHSPWGATVKNADYVWRSGVGVDTQGNVISVLGPALSARSLAEILLDAGAARAMELDINPIWTSAMWYSHPSGGGVLAHKVLPFQRPADRYLSPTSRDFIAAYRR
ncbi:MAG TPA: phosphodiester glycosidase family protein [Microlunatus sp.]|nr:phosphodiester glycosidase family protein [Microlunatus sp.]